MGRQQKLINAYAQSLPNTSARQGRELWDSFSHKDKGRMRRAMVKHMRNVAKAGGRKTVYSGDAINPYAENEKANPGNALLKR